MMDAYANRIKSVYIKEGCNLTVYNDTDFSKGKFIFEAIFDIVVNLKSPLTYYSEAEKAKIIALNNNIQSLELSCENREPLIPESCVEYATQYPEYVALLFNEDDCILKDKSSKPVLLKSGERKSLVHLNTNSNTIKSIFVKQGFSLIFYENEDFSDEYFTFIALNSDVSVTLGRPLSTYSASERARIKTLNNNIRSMKLISNSMLENTSANVMSFATILILVISCVVI